MKYIVLNIFLLLFGTHDILSAKTPDKQIKRAIPLTNGSFYNIVKKEIESGYMITDCNCDGGEAPSVILDKNYMEIEVDYIKKYLYKNGFKFLSKESYNHKIREYFHVNPSLGDRMLYTECEHDTKLEDIIPYGCETRPLYGIYISKKGLITYPYRLPEILNYQTRYPKLYHLEKKLPITAYDADHQRIGSKIFWYDEYLNIAKKYHQNINEVIKFNLKRTLRLNQYLLHGDKTHIDWLLDNTFVLEDLVTEYGYTKDLSLLKKILKRNNFSSFDHLLWYKGCKHPVPIGGVSRYDGLFKIHTNTFKLIANHIGNQKFNTPEENPSLKALKEIQKNLKHNKKLSIKEKEKLNIFIEKFIATFILPPPKPVP